MILSQIYILSLPKNRGNTKNLIYIMHLVHSHITPEKNAHEYIIRICLCNIIMVIFEVVELKFIFI